MKICYVLLSPTFGMHQYTGDLADRALTAGHDVTLVTTCGVPADRYAEQVRTVMPAATRSTGVELYTFRADVLSRVGRVALDSRPDVVHFTGPHLWNPWLLGRLRRAGVRTIHSLHDLDPHTGTSRLLHLWNRAIISRSDHLLVHGQVYRERLLQQGVTAERVTFTPLTHLFVGAAMRERLGENPPEVTFERFVLFFGRVAAYKGVDDLLAAWQALGEGKVGWRLVLAGPGDLGGREDGQLPVDVTRFNRMIEDAEAVELFRRCSLLVLPYKDATQSALIAAAYFFGKPVLATRTGALPEYVVEGETGWLGPAGDPTGLAETLARALSEPRRLPMMGSAGRQWYVEQRAWESAELVKLYERMAC